MREVVADSIRQGVLSQVRGYMWGASDNTRSWDQVILGQWAMDDFDTKSHMWDQLAEEIVLLQEQRRPSDYWKY